jgi:hypothetical protein
VNVSYARYRSVILFSSEVISGTHRVVQVGVAKQTAFKSEKGNTINFRSVVVLTLTIGTIDNA